jgi:hypothetical protein
MPELRTYFVLGLKLHRNLGVSILARAKDSRNFDTPTATISIEINAQISEIIAKFMNEIWGGRQRNSGLGQASRAVTAGKAKPPSQ